MAPIERDESARQPKQSAKAADLPADPAMLLVADDEHLVASGLASSLRELGYFVAGPAANGDEAVEICRTMHPDMALLDIRMPGRDGLEAAEIIFLELGIPVIIFSAYSDGEYVKNSNRIGVFGYLLKPVTQDQLRVGVAVAWGRYLDFAQKDLEIANLKARLEARKTIEQAKWVLVTRDGISEPEAMRTLQRQARNTRRTLLDISTTTLEENQEYLGQRNRAQKPEED